MEIKKGVKGIKMKRGDKEFVYAEENGRTEFWFKGTKEDMKNLFKSIKPENIDIQIDRYLEEKAFGDLD